MTREDIVRNVVGYEGLYKVDIFGNVTRVKDGKEMSQQVNEFGYANVSLCKNGKQKQHKVHRVIAEAFIPNPNNLPEVNHKDFSKVKNNVKNCRTGSTAYVVDTGALYMFHAETATWYEQ